MNKKLLLFSKLIISAVLLFGLISISSPQQADAKAIPTVSLKSSGKTTISRSVSKEGMDVFKINVKKTGAIDLKISNAKQKSLSVIVVSNINEKLMDLLANADTLDEDALDNMTDAEIEALISDLDKVTIHDMLEPADKDMGTAKKYSATIGLKKGTYYVIVATDDDKIKDASYSLTSQATSKLVEYESNDTMAKATPIKKGKVYGASFNLFDEYDYFKVTVQQAGKLVVNSTTAKRADMSFVFYDKNKKKLKKTIKRTGKNYTMETAVKKGTYYVRVEGDSFMQSGDFNVSYNLKAIVKTTAPKVKVVNKKGTNNDTITVSGLKKNATVKIYSDAKKKKLIASKTAKSSTMKLSTKKLKESGASIYVTSKNKGLYTSTIKAVKYSKAK